MVELLLKIHCARKRYNKKEIMPYPSVAKRGFTSKFDLFDSN